LALVHTSKHLATVMIAVALLFASLYLVPNSQAQSVIAFSPNQQFNIPISNGTIRFAFNGTYARATLENDTWVFENLHTYRSTNLTRLEISAQNSNITIFYYVNGNFSNFGSIRLSYAVEGNGKQLINLGLNQSDYIQNANRQWAVVVTNLGASKNAQNYNYLLEGKDWNLMNDGTFNINGLSGNTTLVRYNYAPESNSNLPFYLQHSVAIATGLAFVFVLASLLLIRRKIQANAGDV
jgi:hypothetical protein